MQTYKLLEQDSVLLSQPLLIEHFGRAGAQFLNQLHYWLENSQLGKVHQGQKWIYNTETNWANQLKLSARQFRRHVSKLAEKGIIFVQKLNPHKSNRTNYFSINYALLEELLIDNNASRLGVQAVTRSFVHEDIMSPPSGHSVPIYNDTKTTNKDFNKSEEAGPKGQGDQNQVKQVHDLNLKKLERVLEVPAQINSSEPALQILSSTSLLQKTTTTRDMVAIWNEVLGDKAKTTMSKELAPLLVSAYAKKFDKKLEHWRTYCEIIKSSSYLMGEQFQLSIFWGLKFGTIDRIRAGELGVKRDVLNGIGQGRKADILEDRQIAESIETLEESIIAKQTRRKIAKAIGYAAYHSWFHQAKLINDQGEIKIIAPNRFVESVWEMQYSWIYQGKLEC